MRPLSKSSKPSVGAALSVALVGGFLLTGCSADPIHPEAAGIEKVTSVDWKVDRHPVQFGWGTAEPGRGELARLAAFLAPYDEVSGAYVFVDPGTAVAGEELSARRTERIRTVLASKGFSLRRLPADPAGRPPTAADPRVVTVFVGHYIAVPPDCPDMRKQTAADFTNTRASDFGCATATTLGMMIANPGDLVTGRDPGPADAERAVLGMQRYREPPKKKDGTGINTVATTGAQ